MSDENEFDYNEDYDEDVLAETGETVQENNPLDALQRYHPETILDYAEAIEPLVQVEQTPPSGGDKHHTSQPFLSVYEKTKILSFRSNQLAQGARPYVTVPDHLTNVLEIAKLELIQRKLPYIIKRPMPDKTFEYWRLSDLMII